MIRPHVAHMCSATLMVTACIPITTITAAALTSIDMCDYMGARAVPVPAAAAEGGKVHPVKAGECAERAPAEFNGIPRPTLTLVLPLSAARGGECAPALLAPSTGVER